ncbi:FFLEELY motif protein [Flavobacterium sp. W21_SRS_FM6]|uniref:FFLEELY motif protein n=1 Tax=Flavobacterium sp. W21_SRS_FM6 TaxID=3240268 RepID=UPI003F8F7FC6
MSEHTKQIIRHLHGVKTMQDIAQKGGWLQRIRRLQAWQCQRLMISHQTSYANEKFKPAITFFVNELYGPKDFSQRDKDIARVVNKLSTVVPDKALQTLATALQLYELSFELDFEMVKKLSDQDLNRARYLEAYRACNNSHGRQQQIYLIEVLGNHLAEVVKIRGISALLLLSRKPAKYAGLDALHTFVSDGFKAFKGIGKVEDFILPIVYHEQRLMKLMFAPNQPNPLPDV